ncbi:glycerophosphodiester phosphodiesterase family protein [Hymenobacter rubripertinctus]|uniref:Glycerophosphodiester phosphodiesterase n=1 Tax=Hymenobacter rubripertinctus TaxID=2029981 RepID=A0A418QRP2_9BACT|nr:glycerophosphodiester phosphodiesterase family protein [Hymenobacter rubripertinctus]RIY07939.1 glycerophosphodiester phosphodiesterase [Hymenobacter rubripertinctus]
MSSALTRPFPEIHGHRGCRGLLPENTMPAFREALRLGVDVVELDVVISADHQVVVSHEPWMSAAICRTPAGAAIAAAGQLRHNLYQLPYARIREYDCGLTRHPSFPEQRPVPACKPLLREVVTELENLARQLGRSPVGYSIEVKSGEGEEPQFQPPPAVFLKLVLAELRTLEILPRTTLLSFDKRVLQLARPALPTLPLCLLIEDKLPLAHHLMELGFRPEVLGPDFGLLTPALGAELREQHIKLVPWTVNDVLDMQRVLALAPWGITTDYPNRLLALR